MEQERYSMREWKPPTMDDKMFRLEVKRRELDKEREPFVERKLQIERQLGKLTEEVRGKVIDDDRYREVLKEQSELKREKAKIEDSLKDVKKRIATHVAEVEDLKFQMKKIPSEGIKDGLLELRDKYLTFASDTTRVSSMRAMSSKFVEEIQAMLKLIK